MKKCNDKDQLINKKNYFNVLLCILFRYLLYFNPLLCMLAVFVSSLLLNAKIYFLLYKFDIVGQCW